MPRETAAGPPAALQPAAYWEERARRFGARGAGLGAVCSYGMPAFHNLAIHLTQRAALEPWLHPAPGGEVLDAGAGVGRWSQLLARRGAHVIGVDLSPAMVEEARRRAARERLDPPPVFRAADLSDLDLGRGFDLVLVVTVLQHVLEPERFTRAVANLAAHVRPGGRLVALEAAPTRPSARLDSPVFLARPLAAYLEAFARHGLALTTLAGVDPMPLRRRFLPHYSRLPRLVALPVLAAFSAAALPVDLAFGRRLVGPSWHKLLVFARPREDGR
jgi:2-polyprenyl-3-methyl-5-hydroxy-6-metoxy-1,4-benzoquinol methylase